MNTLEEAEVEPCFWSIGTHVTALAAMRNLEKAWNVKLLDRTGSQSSRFQRRAATREGCLAGRDGKH